MVIIKKTDNTVVIQKEPTDTNIPNFLEIREQSGDDDIKMFMAEEQGYVFEIVEANEAIFGEDALILYFEKVPEEFQVGNHIGLKVGRSWFVDNRLWNYRQRK